MNAPRDPGPPVSDGSGASRARILGLVVLVVLIVLIAMYATGDAFRAPPPPVT